MVQIVFKSLDGDTYEVDAEIDYSVMEAAYNNDVPGVPAECGGAAACGTCHVYVDPKFQSFLDPVSDVEDSMLYAVNNRQASSRLSCQLRVSDDLEGLIVIIADNEVW